VEELLPVRRVADERGRRRPHFDRDPVQRVRGGVSADGHLSLLLECVKDVNRFSSRRQVEHKVAPAI
jgi:hypothetical protein